MRLGWPVYDHELLERIAEDMGVRTSLLESVDERRMNWLKETFASAFDVPFVSDMAYIHRLVKTVLALGSHGECIIVGRGAFLMLPAETTLRVRLIAPLQDRITAMSRQLHISEKDAAHQLEMLDRERKDFVQGFLSKDPTDPRYYDLFLNFARFGVIGCAQLIVNALDCLRARVKCLNHEIAPSS